MRCLVLNGCQKHSQRILNKAKELGIDVPMSRSVGQGQGMLGVIVADLILSPQVF